MDSPGYGFDAIGNRTSTRRETVKTTWTATKLNQYASHNWLSNALRKANIVGLADPAATVTVNGTPAMRQGAVGARFSGRERGQL